MPKKKANYEIVIDDEVKWVIESTKKDADALEIVLDIINNPEKNFKEFKNTGIKLYDIKFGKRRLVAQIEGNS